MKIDTVVSLRKSQSDAKAVNISFSIPVDGGFQRFTVTDKASIVAVANAIGGFNASNLVKKVYKTRTGEDFEDIQVRGFVTLEVETRSAEMPDGRITNFARILTASRAERFEFDLDAIEGIETVTPAMAPAKASTQAEEDIG